jgi:hypothetical protein
VPYRLRRRGFGDTGTTGATGAQLAANIVTAQIYNPLTATDSDTISLCSGPSYYINPFTCKWGTYSQEAWQQMAQLVSIPLGTLIPAPAAIPDATVSGSGSNPACAGMTQADCNTMIVAQQQASLDAQAAQANQNIADWAQTLPDNPISGSSCMLLGYDCTTVVIAGAVALFAFMYLLPSGRRR